MINTFPHSDAVNRLNARLTLHPTLMQETLPPIDAAGLHSGYKEDGFQIINQPILPPDLIDRAIHAQDAVIAGEYATGRAPRKLYPEAPAGSVVKIDDPQISDPVIHETISHPAIGAFAAAITGAEEFVQVWGVTLLVKPGGDSKTANVGWHQDNQYWSKRWTGELFTVWLALTEVNETSGPMVFVRGSQRWGLADEGQFFADDMSAVKARFRSRFDQPWEEVLDLLPAGGMSLHHKELVHGSHLNREATPRRSFAIHMRNERSSILPDAPRREEVLSTLEDETLAPVVWRA